MDSVRESIAVMIQQEDRHYSCRNYMSSELPTSNETCCRNCNQSQRALHLLEECANLVTDTRHDEKLVQDAKLLSVSKSPSAVSVRDFDQSRTTTSPPVQTTTPGCCNVCDKPFKPPEYTHTQDSFAFWRQQMFDWSCVVIDSYGISDRSGVLALCFSILDRYMAHETRHEHAIMVPITRDDYQLFCMTAIYIAVKLTEDRKLTVETLVHMSRGFYTTQDIVATEHEMLNALEWRLCAPTPIAYCRLLYELFLPLLQVQDGHRQWETMQRCIEHLSELAVSDASLVGCKGRWIALACIVLAARLESLSEDVIEDFCASQHEMMDSDFEQVYQHLERLYCD